jgi:hypothetical protein
MGKNTFIEGLKALGYKVTDLGDDRIWFPYIIPSGRFADKEIKLGFAVPGDFPVSPPTGPHISPMLRPKNTEVKTHPEGGIHDSPFGTEWQYWSRPLNHWGETSRTARDVMAHVRHLFDTND